MKRILYVIATLDPGGSEKQLVELATRLDRREFDPHVCCLTRGGSLEADLAKAEVPVHVIGKQAKCDVSALLRLITLMRRLRPQVVHTWLFTSDAYGCAAALATSAPVIVSSRRSTDPWKGFVHRMVDRAVGAFADAVIANSLAVRDVCIRSGVPEGKVALIRNGIDIGRFKPRERGRKGRLRVKGRRRVVGFAGRLVPEKGIACLLEAMDLVSRALPDVLLLVAGDGELRSELKARYHDSPHVGFLGHLDDMTDFYPVLDVLVLPSLWEGLPNAVVEAMACGVPVVATDVGGTGEIVRDGETGLLVPPRSAEALSDAIQKLLESATDRRRMGKRAREFVEVEFRMGTMVSKTVGLYRDLCRQ
ncbi:MAG: glycosyltransferase [Planctomycetes bacterium]|nr:glycosyltransferase [Planctomycetota bacterium]